MGIKGGKGVFLHSSDVFLVGVFFLCVCVCVCVCVCFYEGGGGVLWQQV